MQIRKKAGVKAGVESAPSETTQQPGLAEEPQSARETEDRQGGCGQQQDLEVPRRAVCGFRLDSVSSRIEIKGHNIIV